MKIQAEGAWLNFYPFTIFNSRAAQERKSDQVNLLMILPMVCQYLPIAVVGCGVSP
jgi:hypothetical protein